jgi:hypothetical protein
MHGVIVDVLKRGYACSWREAEIQTEGNYQRNGLGILQIVMHNLAKAEGEVGDEVAGGNHAAHRQAGDVAHRMLEQLNSGWPGPCAF